MIVAATIPAVGQAPGIPGDASMMQDLWTMAKNASPPVACFCVYLWLGERADRRKLQGERDSLLERVLSAINNTANSMEDLVKLLSGGHSKGL